MTGHLLLVAFYFPPTPCIGTVRAWNLAKFLSRVGWKISVLTPAPPASVPPSEAEEIRNLASQEGIRLIYTRQHFRFLAPEVFRGSRSNTLLGQMIRRIAVRIGTEFEAPWLREALAAAEVASLNGVKAIIATGPPFVSATVASILAKRLQIPFILDYRDLWSGNPHSNPRRFRWAQARTSCIERKRLGEAEAITCISPSMRTHLSTSYTVGHKVHLVTNGYDPEDALHTTACAFPDFTLVYTGTFYPPRSVIDPVFRALGTLRGAVDRKGRSWRFHYFGSQSEHVAAASNALGLQDKVTMHGRCSRSECLAALKGADLALVITVVTDSATLAERGIVTGKVFEAINLAPSTLIVAPKNSDVVTLFSGYPNVAVIPGTETQQIARFIRRGMMGGSSVPTRSSKAFSWPVLAAQYDALIRKIIKQSNPPE